MTHTSLQDVSSGSLQRLHRIAYRNEWEEIQADAQACMVEKVRDAGP